MFCVKSSHNEKYEFVEAPYALISAVHMKFISRHLNTKSDRVINYEWSNNPSSIENRFMFGVLQQKNHCSYNNGTINKPGETFFVAVSGVHHRLTRFCELIMRGNFNCRYRGYKSKSAPYSWRNNLCIWNGPRRTIASALDQFAAVSVNTSDTLNPYKVIITSPFN